MSNVAGESQKNTVSLQVGPEHYNKFRGQFHPKMYENHQIPPELNSTAHFKSIMLAITPLPY